MITCDSEKLFADYLEKHGFLYDRNYSVDSGDVDFRVVRETSIVLCDVKEVRDSTKDVHGRLDAGGHIRGDIKKLREKFKDRRPDQPVILVTMNFSTNFFTGLTVATASSGILDLTSIKRPCLLPRHFTISPREMRPSPKLITVLSRESLFLISTMTAITRLEAHLVIIRYLRISFPKSE